MQGPGGRLETRSLAKKASGSLGSHNPPLIFTLKPCLSSPEPSRQNVSSNRRYFAQYSNAAAADWLGGSARLGWLLYSQSISVPPLSITAAAVAAAVERSCGGRQAATEAATQFTTGISRRRLTAPLSAIDDVEAALSTRRRFGYYTPSHLSCVASAIWPRPVSTRTPSGRIPSRRGWSPSVVRMA